MKMTIEHVKNKVRAVAVTGSAALFMLANSTTAYAAGISDSQIAKGTEKLIQDATTWLMVLAPVVAGLLIIYFLSGVPLLTKWIRKSGTTGLLLRWCLVLAQF